MALIRHTPNVVAPPAIDLAVAGQEETKKKGKRNRRRRRRRRRREQLTSKARATSGSLTPKRKSSEEMVFSGYNWISSTIRPASFLIHGTSDLPNRRFQSRPRKKKTLKGLLFFFLRSSKRTKNENGQKGQNELRDAFDEDGGRVGVVERHRLHVEAHALHVDVERLLGAPTRHGLFVVETKKKHPKKTRSHCGETLNKT